jgi:hypothetical protein
LFNMLCWLRGARRASLGRTPTFCNRVGQAYRMRLAPTLRSLPPGCLAVPPRHWHHWTAREMLQDLKFIWGHRHQSQVGLARQGMHPGLAMAKKILAPTRQALNELAGHAGSSKAGSQPAAEVAMQERIDPARQLSPNVTVSSSRLCAIGANRTQRLHPDVNCL